jgi:hypothetical protein
MSFDLKSARPVQPEDDGGFDLATARPVYPSDPDPKAQTDVAPANAVEDNSYDMSEYAPEPGAVDRLTRKARAAARDVAGPVSAADVRRSLMTRESALDKIATGARECAFTLASGMAAAPIAGLAGLAGAALPGPEGQGARWSQGVQNALTYEPRSATGKAVSETVAAPLTLAGEYAGKAGAYLGNKIGGALGGERGALEGEAAGRTIGEVAPAVAATVAGGVSALRARPGSPKATEAEAASRAEAVMRAEAKVGEAGLDWGKLPLAIRKQLTAMATDALQFDKVTPEMVKRVAQLEGLPVPIKGTKGQLTRDPVQLRTEKQLSQTDAGAPIEQRYVEQNRALLDNMDVLANKGSAKATTPEEVGRQVAEKALAAKKTETYQKVKDAYAKANRSAEGAETVSPYPLIDYVRDHPNASAVDWVIGRLKKQQIITGADELTQPQVSRDISLRELSEMRKTAERVAKSGSEGSGWAQEVKDVIDKMSEGAGGKEYATARDAYKAYKSEFDNQGAVRQLLATKGGKYSTDRQVALEDVFDKSVVKGSIQDLRNLRQSLLDAENKGTRKQGRKALNEMAAQTVRYIRDEATKGVEDTTGTPDVSPAKLKQAVDRIGDEKLDLLLGKTSADQLRAVVNATQDLKTSPPRRINGSDTSLNLLNWADKMLEHLPILGPFTRGAAKMAKKAYDTGKADVAADQALLEEQYAPQYRLSDQTELKAFLPGAAAASIAEQVRR